MSSMVYRSMAAIPQGLGATVVTIGNFDGVHCGHRAVIASVVARARELRCKAVLVTFDPHPAVVLRPDKAPKLITPLPEKLRLLCELGLDAVVVLPFDGELARTTARQFAAGLLHDRLHAVEVHEGENFRFGYQAAADIGGLVELGQQLGFAVKTYEPVWVDGAPVSSSRIRAAIAGGQMTLARHLLGRTFSVCSTPARGRGYGTKYAVPTVNLATYEGLLPENGVYVTEMLIGSERFDGVTNVGNRPTFGEDSFAVESYLLRFHPITLDETTPLRLTFLHRLRGERKWPSPEALKAQIDLDVRRAERYLSLRGAMGAQIAHAN
jgi:riboflavin kinase/FMN adenylyltransferase